MQWDEYQMNESGMYTWIIVLSITFVVLCGVFVKLNNMQVWNNIIIFFNFGSVFINHFCQTKQALIKFQCDWITSKISVSLCLQQMTESLAVIKD